MADIEAKSFMDCLGLMVNHEKAVCKDRRLTGRLKMAKLRLQARMANLDYRASCRQDKCLMLH